MRGGPSVAASTLALLTAGTAWAGGAEPVSRAAPWDRVTLRGAAAHPLAVVQRPTEDSPLEVALKGRVAGELKGLLASVGGPFAELPARDLVKVFVALAARDDASVKAAGGVASAVARVALTFAVGELVPRAAGCSSTDHLGAVYEGLAASATFAAFPFPERTGSVAAACAKAAQSAQRLADRAALSQRLGPSALPVNLGEAARACRDATVPEGLSAEAKKALREAISPGASPTPKALAASTRQLRGSLDEIRAKAPQLGAACLAELTSRANLDATVLAKLDAEGLGDLDLGAISAELREDVAPCGSPDACAARALVLRLIGGLQAGLPKDSVALAIRFAAARVGVKAKAGSLGDDLLRAAEAGIVVEGNSATIDEARAVQYLTARLDPTGGRLPSPDKLPNAGQIVGLPPSVVLDVSAGVPAFAEAVRLMGDATVGYRGERLGVVTNLGVNYFDLQSTGVLTDNLHAWGGVEGYALTGSKTAKLRLEGRLSAAADYHDTTTIEANMTRRSSFRFGDYDSVLLRGLLEVGARYAPSERVILGLRLGGGLQHESYDTTSLDARGVNFSSPETLSARGTGKLFATWRFWPRHLSGRFRGSMSVFQLTRETLSFSASSTGSTQASLSSATQTEIDLEGRGYIDADHVKLFGIVPSFWFGSSYVSTPAAATLVPAAGIALLRPE